MTANSRAALLGLTAFGVFAAHDVIVKVLGSSYAPAQILFFSTLLTFPLFSVLLVSEAQPKTLRPVHPRWVAVRTATMVISTLSIFYAFSVLPLAQTYAILFCVPLIITLLSVPFLGERVGRHRGGAVIAGLIGVLIVLRPGATELTIGHAAALLGAFSAGLSSIAVRKIGKDERQAVLLLFPMLGTVVVMGVLLPLNYAPMTLSDLGLLALMSVLGFAALNCLIMAYKTGEAAVVAPMQYSQILWASLYGYLLFNETLDVATIVGVMVIIASGIYIIWRESRANISRNTPVLKARTRMNEGAWRRAKEEQHSPFERDE